MPVFPESSELQPANLLDRIAFTGRFQPFHVDHLVVAVHALSLAQQVLICITNPDFRSLQPVPESDHRHSPAANPFTWFERLGFIEAALAHHGVARGRYVITPFPLDAPSTWPAYVPAHTPQLVRVFSEWEREKARRFAAAEYPVIALQGDPEKRVSASNIRAAMARRDNVWRDQVPAGTLSVLDTMGEDELRRRCAAPATDASHA